MMLDVLKFTFETYSHFWGMVLLIWLLTGGIRIVVGSFVQSITNSIRKGMLPEKGEKRP
jgi:hypothetical protein